MRRAIIIRCDHTCERVELPDDPNEELAVLNDAVDGYIELVPVGHGVFTMYCNEEGKVRRFANADGDLEFLPVNRIATEIAGVAPHDVIVGDVLITGPPDGTGETTDIPDRVLELVERACAPA